MTEDYRRPPGEFAEGRLSLILPRREDNGRLSVRPATEDINWEKRVSYLGEAFEGLGRIGVSIAYAGAYEIVGGDSEMMQEVLALPLLGQRETDRAQELVNPEVEDSLTRLAY